MTTDNNRAIALPKQPSWWSLATYYLPGDVIGGILAYFLFCHRELGPALGWFVFLLLLSIITLKVRRVMWQMRYHPANQ